MKIHLRYVIALILTPFLVRNAYTQDLSGYDKMIEELVQDPVPYMEVSELSTNSDKEIYILDTRERSEYKVSHIPNAKHVGYLFFTKRSLKDIPKDAIIVTYCSVGYRSGKIGDKLMQSGYTNVFNLKGGIFSWANADLPMLDDENNSTKTVHGYNSKWSKWLNPDKCEITY